MAIYNYKLKGPGVITEVDQILQLDIKTKLEQNYYLDENDPEEVIDFSDVQNIRLVTFISDKPFNIKISEGVSFVNVKVSEYFLFTTENISNITGLAITSLNSTKHYIQVRIYGVNA